MEKKKKIASPRFTALCQWEKEEKKLALLFLKYR